MMPWLEYFLLLFISALGLILLIFAMPGLWLMAGAAAIYAILTHERFLGIHTLLVLLSLAAIAEVFDWTIAGAAARRAGAGKYGIIGALLGGFIGGIGATFIPIPVIATILGVCIGTFLGAAGGEWISGASTGASLRIGAGATKGRIIGFAGKFAVGAAMLLLVLVMAFP